MNKPIDIVTDNPYQMTYNKEWYRPMEIAKLGMIQSRSGANNPRGNYNLILNLIAAGKLKAKDYSTVGAKPYYMVHADEIERYRRLGQ